MNIQQTFETTISDQEAGCSLRFLVFPKRSIAAHIDLVCTNSQEEGVDSAPGNEADQYAEGEKPEDNRKTAKEAMESVLRIKELNRVRPALLPQVIQAMIRADKSDDLRGMGQFMQLSALLGQSGEMSPVAEFATMARS